MSFVFIITRLRRRIMKKLVLSFLALFVLAFALPALAAQPEVPADGIQMKNGKKLVVFNHSTHKDTSCASCHHPVDGKEDFRKCSTAGCHDDFKAKKGVKSYYHVMHARKDTKFDSCVSCHLKVAGTDAAKKKELAGCAKSKCHP